MIQRFLQQNTAKTPLDSLCTQNSISLNNNETRHPPSEDSIIIIEVNSLLRTAIKLRASDLHIEPLENTYQIRYRVDGILSMGESKPINIAIRMVTRIKVMSLLDISERRLPQDGRFKIMDTDGTDIDCRVSTCPLVTGEKMVIRLLNQDTNNLAIATLGFDERQKEIFLHAINRPQGLILVTGPTGSGKTVTLYSALHHLNTPEKNIVTAEDPIEIKIPGINQVNINIKTGLTFAETLRAFLRQDPDIIMIGEIRDAETAEIAIKAAQTGHLVLATLHTNSAAETLMRLVNMGVSAFNIAQSTSLIIAQRLVRRLCINCKIPCTDTAQSYKAVGCHQCIHGYNGRIALFEVLPMSNAIEQLMITLQTPDTIQKQAESMGFLTMAAHGLQKVREGVTTSEEVQRVTMWRFLEMER